VDEYKTRGSESNRRVSEGQEKLQRGTSINNARNSIARFTRQNHQPPLILLHIKSKHFSADIRCYAEEGSNI
jgi:hypothetical protein